MELLHRVTGPVSTNVWILGDEASREAMCIDAATPSVDWITASLAERGWTLKLVVSTHRHWDHIGDNAAVVDATGATLAAHLLDRHGLERPSFTMPPPFPLVPSVPALDLAEGSVIRFGGITLDVLHTPGHTEGSVCLLAESERLLFSGDTLFQGAWGRTDLPGGSSDQMVESITRLASLDPDLTVLPGHGQPTSIERELPWMDIVSRERRLLL
jgi:glyoxylase-like metal-dependent hydrolase (beta-lactamase superfamily II)